MDLTESITVAPASRPVEEESATVAPGTRSGAPGASSAAPRGAERSPEKVIAGRFEVLDVLGKGGMGQVYKGFDRQLERTVAIKRLLPALSKASQAVERFMTEARSVAALVHQNVVNIYDIGADEHGKYIVMEFVDGESLSAKLRREGKLGLHDTIRIMLQIGRALQAAHERGVIHRDIKPGNILLTSRGVPKLADFGLAQLTHKQDVTKTGTAMGTWSYASPEQLSDAKHVDHRSDIFSCGAMMYEMVTGQSPRHIHDNAIPEALRPVILKCIAENPAVRYQSAKELLSALSDAYRRESGEQQAVKPPPSPQSSSSKQRAAAPPPPKAPASKRSTTTPLPAAPARKAAPPPPKSSGPRPAVPRTRASGTMPRPGGAAATGGKGAEMILWKGRRCLWSRPVWMAFFVVCFFLALLYSGDINQAILGVIVKMHGQMGNTPSSSQTFDYLMGLPYATIVMAASICFALLPLWGCLGTEYRVTPSRLVVKSGVILGREQDYPIREFTDVVMSRGLFGALLGYGRIIVSRPKKLPVILEGVPQPAKAKQVLTGQLR